MVMSAGLGFPQTATRVSPPAACAVPTLPVITSFPVTPTGLAAEALGAPCEFPEESWRSGRVALATGLLRHGGDRSADRGSDGHRPEGDP
jgi:hypothetical protein